MKSTVSELIEETDKERKRVRTLFHEGSLEDLLLEENKLAKEKFRLESRRDWLRHHKYIKDLAKPSNGDIHFLNGELKGLRIRIGELKSHLCPTFINEITGFYNTNCKCDLKGKTLSWEDNVFFLNQCYPCPLSPEEVQIELIARELTKRKPEEKKEIL